MNKLNRVIKDFMILQREGKNIDFRERYKIIEPIIQLEKNFKNFYERDNLGKINYKK